MDINFLLRSAICTRAEAFGRYGSVQEILKEPALSPIDFQHPQVQCSLHVFAFDMGEKGLGTFWTLGGGGVSEEFAGRT